VNRNVGRSLHVAISRSAVGARSLPVLGGLLLIASTAHAEMDFKPYAQTLYGYNSNVFAQRQDGSGTVDDEADKSLSYGAGFSLDSEFGRQKITLTANGQRTKFQEFEQLNHNEYDGNATWDWKLGRLFDGLLGYSVMQRMVPFADTQEVSTELLLENSRRADVGFNIAVSPRWRLETQASRAELESPREGAPTLEQTDDLIGAGLMYVGRARMSAGVEFTDTDGEVTGLQGVADRNYDQRTGQFVANYNVSGRSSFGATLGYTKRNDDVSGDVDAVTGTLGYNRALTRKTSATIQFSRLLNSYLVNNAVQTELATALSLGANWQATAKTGLAITFGYQQSEFPNQVFSSVVEDREDDFAFSELHVNYQVARWLLIHPFVRYEERDSNDPTYSYDNTYAGLQLKVTMR
jgi:hypothetical protein